MANIVQEAGNYRQRNVSDLSDQHLRRLQNSLYELENQVISEAAKIDPTKGTLKVRTTAALAVRPKLKQYIENTFLTTVQSNIQEYDKAAGWLVASFDKYPIPDAFKEITELDLTTIQQLKRTAYLPFEDLGNQFSNDLAQEVYDSVLTGTPQNEMLSNLKGKINGVYQASDNEEAQDLVNFIRDNPDDIEGIKSATQRLGTIYGRDKVGNNLRRYAGQLMQDSLMGFDGQFAKYRADELGLDHYVYSGTSIDTTRNHCNLYVGKTLSEEDIREIWKGDWKGKAQGDPFIKRGGYNCRHHWQPTDPEWGKTDSDFPVKDEDVEQVEPVKSEIPNVAIASLLTSGSQKIRKQYEDEFNTQLTNQQKIILNKYPKPRRIINGQRGYYDNFDKTLSAKINQIDKTRYSKKDGVKGFVMSHEYGHHIDYETSKTKFFAWSETNDDFKEAIIKDRKRFKGRNYSNGWVIDESELKKMRDEIADTGEIDIFRDGRKVARATYKDLKGDGFGNVSDIIDALARGKFRKNYGMWGHDVAYYRRRGAIEKEIFANLFSLRHNKKAYNQAKKYIPNTVNEFEKRLLELEKRGIDEITK